VYAEDPARDFLPSCGTLRALTVPEGPGLRVDAAWREGLEVTPFYDPLLAKLIAHGETRDAALTRLDEALARTAVLGVKTNVGYLRAILADAGVRAAALSTDLLDRRGAALALPAVSEEDLLLAVAAEALLGPTGHAAPASGAAVPEPAPWRTLSGWRPGEGGA
jgi:acetyl-CoA/propionyl-CoA carboxylase biotin carboxyl carrier protein